MLKLPGRYYRTLPIDDMQYETEELELDPTRTSLVVMHCWNIGCEDGPEVDPGFWVGMGSREALAEAERIMREVIRPSMDAARRAGILVSHVESEGIAAKHREAQEDTDPPPEPPDTPPPPPVVPGWRERIVARSHGKDYATKSPYAHMDRAKVVQPLPGEPFVYQTAQFDRALRRQGIENLIYTGFATDMCTLRAPGGIEPMSPYGYRLFLMRDATLGVELPDTFDELIATRWGIRYFEALYGDTVLSADFIEACEALG
jgi:nicotinamidase-related amidase